MPRIDEATLKKARMGSVPISICDLPDRDGAIMAVLTGAVPAWVGAELSNDGVVICRDRSGHWFLDPLSD